MYMYVYCASDIIMFITYYYRLSCKYWCSLTVSLLMMTQMSVLFGKIKVQTKKEMLSLISPFSRNAHPPTHTHMPTHPHTHTCPPHTHTHRQLLTFIATSHWTRACYWMVELPTRQKVSLNIIIILCVIHQL